MGVKSLRYGRLALVLAIGLLAAACGTSTAQLAAIQSGYADPTGDTAAGAPVTVYDITKVETQRVDNSPYGSYDTLVVKATFNQTVVLPPAGGTGDVAGTQILPEIAIDTDQDPTTGAGYGCGTLGFSMPGGEFFVFSWEGAGRLANGNYEVYESSGFTVVGEATPSASGNVLTISIPLSALGGDDGAARVGVFAGNNNGAPALVNETDCAPNGGGMVITRNGKPVVGVDRR